MGLKAPHIKGKGGREPLPLRTEDHLPKPPLEECNVDKHLSNLSHSKRDEKSLDDGSKGSNWTQG